MVPVKCDIHPREIAWLGVVRHPFFAVTDEKGKFEIKGLPAGAYAIEGWHEKHGSVQAEATVRKEGKATVILALKDRK